MEFIDSTGRMFRTEDINGISIERKLKQMATENAFSTENAILPTSETQTFKREVSLETGPPPVSARGGPSGRSKYQSVFDKVKELGPGKGWVRIPTTPDQHDKHLAHVRTALKRQGLFNPDVVKVKSSNTTLKTELCVFIPEDADIDARDLDAPAK